VQRDDDEDAWRAIVENYGDPVLGTDDPLPPPPVETPASWYQAPDAPAQQPSDADDSFVPPTPPPLPRPTGYRLLAWLGIFGSPSILLISLLFSFPLPSWIGYLLVAGFVGGFLYLVAAMPRGPREPWDDGAEL
jgi:hypothetical protein